MSSNGDGSAAAAMAANIQPGGGYGIYECGGDQKSVNLQYNMLGCWVDGTINSLTKHLMFQVLFFLVDTVPANWSSIHAPYFTVIAL